jgi:hypothetical protein
MEPDTAVRARKTKEKATVAGGLMGYFRSPCVTSGQKLVWLKVTVATALISGFVLSWRLWVSSRLFPLSPVSDYLPVAPFPFDYIWFFSLLGLLLAIIVVRRPRWLVVIFLALAGSMSLSDQTRWQPWFYQYFFLLAAMWLYAWKDPEGKNHQAALNACRAVIVFTYFWSGLQKLNANFVKETWPDMAGPLLNLLPEAARRVPAVLILAIPLLEILISIGLITRKFRNVSVVLAMVTHAFVLILLIFSGENKAVWPWNIAMALFVLILFWQGKETAARELLVPKNGFHALILLLFGVLPALSFVDLWDSYLSAALYSGNTDQAVIYVTPSVIDRLPAAIHPHIWQRSQPFFLDINRWSYGELNVPLYPEPRIYRRVTEQICSYSEGSSDVRLRIKEKPNPFTAARKSEFYDCDHLDSVH